MYNMKKFLPLIALVICAATANSQTGSLLFNENFTGLTNGNLTNANGGWTTATTPNVQVLSTTPLVSSGYASGTTYVNIQRATGDDPRKTFIGATTVNNTDATFYLSFVVRVASTISTPSSSPANSAAQIISLRNAAGTSLGSFYVADDGTNLKFGINKLTGQSASTIYAAATYSFNTTYLIVIRYDFVSGATNDRMFLFVNPSLAAEPATGSAAASITGAVTDPTAASSSAIASLQLFQNNIGGGGAAADVDAFKMAYGTGSTQAANSAFAWTTLSPSGATLPIKVNYFNAAKGDGYNTLNWRAECTSAQATFVIERATNGTDFAAINTITASQQRCQQPFDYTDNGAGSLGTLYYRLKVIDENGKVNYSSIVKISAQQKDMQLVGVSPNPVVNMAQLSIASAKKDIVDLQVISLDGKVVSRTRVTLQPGTSVVNIEVASLQKGVYTVKGVFSNGEMSTVRFVK
jgi:Secretion system C-terminal sorting domain